jgi:hypothetical protein
VPVPNSQIKRSLSDTFTILWAANESFAGAFLHALNIPLKGIYLTGFSIVLLQMIAETAAGRLKLIMAGVRVSAVKAVINPFASFNSHFAVLAQSFIAGIVLSQKKNTLIRLMIFSITAMMLSALQRLVTLWLFYGIFLYDAVNIFMRNVLKELGADGTIAYSDFSFTLITFYLTAYLTAGVIAGVLIYRMSRGELSNETAADLSDRLEVFRLNNNLITSKSGKRLKWIAPVFILISLGIISYSINSENSFVIISLILIRYLFALLLLFFIRTLYTRYIHRKMTKNTDRTPDFIEKEDVLEMKIYFSFAYNETRNKPLYKRPVIFFRTLITIAKISAVSQDKYKSRLTSAKI